MTDPILLSTLIKKLVELKDEHGDIPVTCFCECMDAGMEVTYSENAFDSDYRAGPIVLLGEKP